jgi:V-type H+-transporting ATPase subunit H
LSFQTIEAFQANKVATRPTNNIMSTISTFTSSTLLKSPVVLAFPYIQWDTLSTSLKLTPQETALLRMAETNPMDYTLADSRDASMYARVLLKLLAEATQAGAGTGRVSNLNSASISAGLSSSATDVFSSSSSSTAAVLPLTEPEAMDLLNVDPLSVVSHYALSKLLEILDTLSAGVKGVTTASVFYVGKEGILVEQWKALLRLLNKGGKGDMYAQKVASLCLAKLLIVACPSQRSKSATADKEGKYRPIQFASAMEPLEAITAWIVSQLKNTSGPYVAICTPALKVLMETPETRALFCKSGGVKYMARQLRIGTSQNKAKVSTTVTTSTGGEKKKIGQASVQQLYEISFCLWILTYELNNSMSIRADFAKDTSAVAALVDLVSVAPREKVVRVALSSLCNLATISSDIDTTEATTTTSTATVVDAKFFLSEMIACGLMKAIDHLRDRQFTDPDLVNDVNVLHKLLHDNYKEMSRWEVYKNEVESGHLQWGSTHTEAFFKENARMMEGSDGDFHLVKVLIALLSSKDEEACAVACFDIGEFVRHYPNGRAIAKRLGAKELVMPLIEHENPELQRQALQCVSKIMVQNWEFVK